MSVANGLGAVGSVDIVVERYEWTEFLKLYITGSEDDYNMYTLGWVGITDPDSLTYFLLARAVDVLGVTNGCFWSATGERRKEASRKFMEARRTASRDERLRLYREGITLALEDPPHVPAYTPRNA